MIITRDTGNRLGDRTRLMAGFDLHLFYLVDFSLTHSPQS